MDALVKNKKLTPLGIGLLVSAIIVFLIGISVVIITFLKAKKIRKEIEQKTKEATEQAILRIKGSELGETPSFINEAFKSCLDELDILHLINTIYLNNAKEVLLIGNNLENEYLTFKNMTQANIALDESEKVINKSKWNDAVLKFPDKIKEAPLFFNFKKDEPRNFDLIYVLNSNQSNINIFDNYFKLLNEDGMILVLQNEETKRDLRIIKKDLKFKNIPYEVSKNKGLFLYIVKRSI